MTLVPFRCCPLRAVRSLFPWPREGQELTTSRTASPWWTGSGPPILGSRFIFLFLDINIIWVAIQICKKSKIKNLSLMELSTSTPRGKMSLLIIYVGETKVIISCHRQEEVRLPFLISYLLLKQFVCRLRLMRTKTMLGHLMSGWHFLLSLIAHLTRSNYSQVQVKVPCILLAMDYLLCILQTNLKVCTRTGVPYTKHIYWLLFTLRVFQEMFSGKNYTEKMSR